MAPRKRLFKRESKLYQLNFEDGELDGFVCIMKGVSLEKYINVARLAADLLTPEGQTPENIEKQFSLITDLLVEWNLADEDDNEVPATYEGLKVQDFSFVMEIMKAYMAALSAVPKASDDDSNSGETSPEQSLGLGRLSSVQGS